MLQAILSFPEVKGESQEGVMYVFFFHDSLLWEAIKMQNWIKNSGTKWLEHNK